jgi:hypothetical protein
MSRIESYRERETERHTQKLDEKHDANAKEVTKRKDM